MGKMGSTNQRMKYQSGGQGDEGSREVAAIGMGRVNSFEINLGAESAALGHWWGIQGDGDVEEKLSGFSLKPMNGWRPSRPWRETVFEGVG